LQENFKIDRQINKLNILVLDKTFCIIYIYYLFALCKLLKKIIKLTILKRDLYKHKRKILISRQNSKNYNKINNSFDNLN